MATARSALSADAAAPPGGAWRIALVLAAAVASAAAVLWAIEDPLFAAAFLAGLIGLGAILSLASRRPRAEPIEADPVMDVALLRAAIDRAPAAVAVTDADDGSLICANERYTAWFGSELAPTELDEREQQLRLAEAAIAARRDGRAEIDMLLIGNRALRVAVEPAGLGHSWLVWSFAAPNGADVAADARRLVSGEGGRRLGEAGVMAVLVDGEGNVVTGNRAFISRAAGRTDAMLTGEPLVELIGATESGSFHLAIEGPGAAPLRLIQVAIAEAPTPLALFLLLDDPSGGLGGLRPEEGAGVNALLDSLPLGLALINIDGRLVHLNKSFRKAAGLAKDERPIYPGDLVVEQDKAPLSDAVRRFARGPATHSDISLRLRGHPDESVMVKLAGVRGVGEAAVLLSMKDNSEEARLKQEIAQATKMQAVGQLAGGVAHDFNNILTAIIGHCDLMLMRHTPGDSDYDDIQQIRSNSNRAANLTRHLLAFSRQQTLVPQVLQLPDVIAEVSNLLKRLLGETVTLSVKHGRNLGPVRADPGQLEQVIVNLALNARDAMAEGGTLTIQTYAVAADEVRAMGSDIMPVGDYTAVKVSDTGTGIQPAIIGKIFEPFFTTKEVGKGTGLGLSTVYGIVKQSGGFIFADSELGEGTSFTIYLPVHRGEEAVPVRAKVQEKAGELWGSGTILLVEDEATVRHVAERALTRHGYTVLSAENGEAALEILEREGGVDLMISDVVMPTMDGPTTVREARKTHPDLPILFISGYAEEHLRKSIDLDKVAFLAKPFSVQKLAEAVRDVLQAK